MIINFLSTDNHLRIKQQAVISDRQATKPIENKHKKNHCKIKLLHVSMNIEKLRGMDPVKFLILRKTWVDGSTMSMTNQCG